MCGNLGAPNLALWNGKKAKISFDNEILVFILNKKFYIVWTDLQEI